MVQIGEERKKRKGKIKEGILLVALSELEEISMRTGTKKNSEFKDSEFNMYY